MMYLENHESEFYTCKPLEYNLVEFLAWNPKYNSGIPGYPYYHAPAQIPSVVPMPKIVGKYVDIDREGKSFWFLAVIAQAGRTGMKSHIGSVKLSEFQDGSLRIDYLNTGCAVGTHTRGGCSGSRDLHYFEVSGKHKLTCQTKHCQNWGVVDLDKENANNWIQLKSYFGVM